jgi:hypothetical protein
MMRVVMYFHCFGLLDWVIGIRIDRLAYFIRVVFRSGMVRIFIGPFFGWVGHGWNEVYG